MLRPSFGRSAGRAASTATRPGGSWFDRLTLRWGREIRPLVIELVEQALAFPFGGAVVVAARFGGFRFGLDYPFLKIRLRPDRPRHGTTSPA